MKEKILSCEARLFEEMLLFKSHFGEESPTFLRARTRWSSVYDLCVELGLK